MIRKSIKKKVVSAIFSLVIMVILLHGFTVSVAAAPVSGTLLFTGPEGVTNIGLMAHDNILINNVSGTDIPNIELDIYGALNESNATNGIRDGSVVYYYDAVNGFTGIGPIDVESGDVTQVDANIPRYFIIKSHNGAEFSFQSIDVYDYIAGNSPIKFEGFRDGISTGSNILQIISSKETFTLGNQLNQSVFQNVDEIRITNQNEGDMTWGIYAVINNIKINDPVVPQATPSFSPVAGAIAFGSTVTITSTGAEHIYYTTDGTDPGTLVGGSTLEYIAPITVNSAMTIKAIATRTNYVNSVIGSASYTQDASADLANIALSGTPSNFTFTGASDTYNGVTVGNGVDSITVTPSGAGTITVEGITVNSGEASASINLTPGVEKIITVVVTETGKTAKTYTIKVTRQMATQATPSFSPAAGAIAFGSTVTITSTGAEHIYYTTDGTDPGTVVGGSTLEYTAPVTVNSAMTIKAIATRTNYVNSVIGSASYTQAASADLANIALSGTPSNYTFTGASDTYTGVTVGNGVDSITVTPSGAGTITVDAVTVNSGEASAPINLTPGVEKIITVVVTETGKTAKTYTIKVILSIPSYSNNNSIGDQDKKGLIIKEQLQDESVPNTNLNNTTDELKEAVFTTEELSKIKEGEDAKVILKVTDISNSVSEDDKKLIAKKLDGDVPPIMYIDLSLYKKVGNGTETKITETNKKISISIEVPVELRNTDLTKSRTYQIVRIHDGEVTVIKGTYDSIKGLFTFETDRFSTYALTFVDRNTGENENFVKIMKDFFHLRLTAKAAETSQILKYTNISGADGYIIYGAICGSNNKLVKLADVSGKITSYNHKGLKKSTYYKYQVQAYKIINDKKVIFAKSKVIHSVTISKNYDNPKKLISEVSDLTLAVGESKKVTCQVVLPVSKKMKQHTDIICYETSNKAIAIVSPNGKIKAISRGSCYIYAYAQNGVYKKINVTIK